MVFSRIVPTCTKEQHEEETLKADNDVDSVTLRTTNFQNRKRSRTTTPFMVAVACEEVRTLVRKVTQDFLLKSFGPGAGAGWNFPRVDWCRQLVRLIANREYVVAANYVLRSTSLVALGSSGK